MLYFSSTCHKPYRLTPRSALLRLITLAACLSGIPLRAAEIPAPPPTAPARSANAPAVSQQRFELSGQGYINALAVYGPTAKQKKDLPPLISLARFRKKNDADPESWTLYAVDYPDIAVPFSDKTKLTPPLQVGTSSESNGRPQFVYYAFDWIVTGDESRGLAIVSGCPFTVFVDDNPVLDKTVTTRPVRTKTAVDNLTPGRHRVLIAVMRSPISVDKLNVQIVNSNSPPYQGNEIQLPLQSNGVTASDILTRLFIFQSNTKKTVVTTGDEAEIISGLIGVAPLGTSDIGLRVTDPAGNTLASAEPQSPVTIQKSPFRVKIRVPAPVEDYRSTVICRLIAGGKDIYGTPLYFYNIEQLGQYIDKLTTEFNASGHASRADGLLELLKARSILTRLRAGRVFDPSMDVKRIVDHINTAARILHSDPATDYHAADRSLFERAYISDVDGSVQPYQIYVPTAYNPAMKKRWPLIIFLHGYVPSYTRDNWMGPLRDMNRQAEKYGYIVAIPFGRSNTDFLNVGERDVLDVLKNVVSTYRIDPSRVYLTGFSMGGSGVYTIAAHYPELWSAAIALSGRTDYWLWHEPTRKDTPAWMTLSILMDNPIDQIENFRNVPMKIYHGGRDSAVKLAHSSIFTQTATEAGIDISFKIMPEGSHFVGWDILPTDAFWKFLDAHPRRPRTRFTRKAWSKKYMGQDDGIWFSGMNHVDWPMEVDVEYDKTAARIVVHSLRNLNWMVLDPAKKLGAPVNTPVMLADNLTGRFAVRPLAGGQFLVSEKNLASPPLSIRDAQSRAYISVTPHKEGKLVGPVRDIMTQPWVIVYGTAGDDAATARLRKEAERLQKEWRDFAKGEIAIIADTDADRDPRSLYLLGSPKTNRYIATLSPFLPVVWSGDSDQSVTLGREKPVDITGGGMIFCYPDVLRIKKLLASKADAKTAETPDPAAIAANERMVVIQQGESWGLSLPINHKWDLVPDFIIYESETETIGQPINLPKLTAFFDYNWRYDPATTWSQQASRIHITADTK